MAKLDQQLRLIVECLERHRVSYVVIGGVAAMLQDVPIAETLDVDVVPQRKTKNLKALANALKEMGNRSRGHCRGRIAFRHPRQPSHPPYLQRALRSRDRRGRSSPGGAAGGGCSATRSFKSGHSIRTRSGSISNHFYGRAVDIYAVDGIPVSSTNRAARAVVHFLAGMPDPVRPTELGHPFGDLRLPGGFSDADHGGHLHVGFDD